VRIALQIAALTAVVVLVTDASCLQSRPPECQGDIACKTAHSAISLVETEPDALQASTALLADSISHMPSLFIDRNLRANLELLRIPLYTLNFQSAARNVAISRDGTRLAIAYENGTLSLFEPCELSAGCWKRIKDWREDTAPVIQISFSASGQYLAAADEHGLVRIFNVHTFTKTAEISHEQIVRAVVFSEDEQKVASAGDDSMVYIFDSSDGGHLLRLRHLNAVTGVRFTPDGSRVITSSTDGWLRIFDLRTHNSPTRKFDTRVPIRSLAVSADHTWIAAGGEGKLTVWHFPEMSASEFALQGTISVLAFGHNSRWIAAGTDNGLVQLFNVATKVFVAPMSLKGPINSLSFSGDGQWLAIAPSDNTARIFDIAHGFERARIVHMKPVNAVSFTPDDALLLTASADGNVAFSHVLGAGERLHVLTSEVSAATLSPEGKMAVIALRSGKVSLFNVASGQEFGLAHREGNESSPVVTMAFANGGDLLATADEDSTTRIFVTSTPKSSTPRNIIRRRATGGAFSERSWITSLAINSDSKLMVIAERAGVVRTRDPLLSGQDAFLALEYPGILSAALDNTGRLAIGSTDHTAHIFQKDAVGQSRAWKELKLPALMCTDELLSLTFNPNGQLLAIGVRDERVEIYRVADGALAWVSPPYGGRILALAFDGQGTILAAGTSHGLIHLINTDTFEEIGQISSLQSEVRSLTFGSGGHSLWALSIDRSADHDDILNEVVSVREFPVHAEDLVTQACKHISKYPTAPEWRSYGIGEEYHNVCAESHR
jgi:WD40 repeat protein